MITGHNIYDYLNLSSKDDCFGVYVGVQEIRGHYAQTKIGRSRNAQAIQRGRQQGELIGGFTLTFYFQLMNLLG